MSVGARAPHPTFMGGTPRTVLDAPEPEPASAWAVIEHGEMTLEEWVALATEEVRA